MRLAYILPMSPMPMIPTVVPSMVYEGYDQSWSLKNMRAFQLQYERTASSSYG